MKLIMLKGLPGSGKSTWAIEQCKASGYVRVNKDSLRKMIGSYTRKDEKYILGLRDSIISNSLSSGKSVIVDDTNFHPKHEEWLKRVADTFLAEFEVVKFDLPLEDCIKNDLKRLDSVGEKVIRKMYNEYLKPVVPIVKRDPSLPTIIICDLDGTLALHNGRSPYDTDKCDTDILNKAVASVLWNRIHPVIFVSGREERHRDKSIQWICYNMQLVAPKLFMRPTGDFRKDFIIKQEIYDREIKGKYNVAFVLDDRDRVVKMWRDNGLTCLQVAEGDF